MKTFVGLWASSATFGVVIAAVYYIWSHGELAGTVLLGTMAIGLAFAAGYAIVAERDANLSGDRAVDNNQAARGEDLGVYTTRSAWPILLAFCVLVVLVGALWVPLLLFAGIAAMLLILWRLGAESSRTG
ncbi:MAG: cytochrome c oxidase subunit 4 [Candidatus Aquilonibacter sp.]